jgi:mannose-6-phosphate isomerase
MSTLYPLRFQPLLKRYLWGGRRLETLGKTLGEGHDYAESWEIVDRSADQSRVVNGALAGTSLGRLLREHGRELLGRHAGLEQFPLLVKFLDAHQQLSIQVHPDDARAAMLDPPDLGKTEAWVILATSPGSYLYAGLKRGFDRQALAREIDRGTCELCVERIEPSVGDCYFLPAGVVHALGPGLLVAEIQQASDTTYRLYDWNRTGPDGRPRQLHIDEALAAIDYDYGPVVAQRPQPTAEPPVERFVACDQFVLDRWRLPPASAPIRSADIGGDERCHLVIVLNGSLEIASDPASLPLQRGAVVLLPAEIGSVKVRALGSCEFLDAYLP